MRTSIKILISLIFSSAVFTGLFIFSTSKYGSIVETRLYQPAVVRSLQENLNKIAASSHNWHTKNEEAFSEFIQNGFVRRTALQDQSSIDIKMRDDAAYYLMNSAAGLMGIRIIDSETLKIHYSTFSVDIVMQSDFLISYRKYGKEKNDIPFEYIAVPSGGDIKITSDTQKDLFLYCVPFYDMYQTYRGVAVFYVSSKALLTKLITEKIVTLTDNIGLVNNKTYDKLGLLTGLPQINSSELKEAISLNWENNFQDLTLISLKDSKNLILISKTDEYGYLGLLCEKDLFTFSPIIKYFLLFIAFITVFLITFLVLNIRQDRFFIAKNKIQQLHLEILKIYVKNADSKNWEELQQKLEYRRHEVNAEIKKGLGRRILKKREVEIDEILQKSWDDIFSAINGKYGLKKGDGSSSVTDNEELANLLRQVLTEANTKGLKTAPVISKQENYISDKKSDAENTSNLESLEEAEQVESLEELTDSDLAEDIEPVEEIEPIEEVQALDEVEEAESLEEIRDSETPELLEEVEAVEEITGTDSLKEAEIHEDGLEPISVSAEDTTGKIEEPISIETSFAEEEKTLDSTDSIDKTEKNLSSRKEVSEQPKKRRGLRYAAEAKAAELDGKKTVQETSPVDDLDSFIDNVEVPVSANDKETLSGTKEKTNKDFEIETLDSMIDEAEELEFLDDEPVPVEEAELIEEDSEPEPKPQINSFNLAISEFESVADIEALNNKQFIDSFEDEADVFEDPMKMFDDMGFTVSGLDFSELENSESYIDKSSDSAVEEVSYMEDDSFNFKDFWGKYPENVAVEKLEKVDDNDVSDLLPAEADNTIVNEDGIFVIRNSEKVLPKNKEFKALVDSVLK